MMPETKEEWFKVSVIFIGAVALLWFAWIKPLSIEWQISEETSVHVEALQVSSGTRGTKVFAVSRLDTGKQIFIRIPIDRDVRAGDDIVVNVMVDSKKPNQKRYVLKPKEMP